MTVVVTDLGESGGYKWLKISSNSTSKSDGSQDTATVNLSSYLSNGQTVALTLVGGGANGVYVRGGAAGWMVESESVVISNAAAVAVNIGVGGAGVNDSTGKSGGDTTIAGLTAWGGIGHGKTNAHQGGSGGQPYEPGDATGATNGASGRGIGYGQSSASNVHYTSAKTNTTGLDGVRRCGGGGGFNNSDNTAYPGGSGGGGNASNGGTPTSGTDDYGGGGGGVYPAGGTNSGSGGNGVIIIRYSAASSNYSGVSLGSSNAMVVGT